jgi:hypothetical protein
LLEDNLLLATTVCDVTQATEIDKVAKAFVYIFYHHNRTSDLLKFRIKQEIYHSGNFPRNFQETYF